VLPVLGTNPLFWLAESLCQASVDLVESVAGDEAGVHPSQVTSEQRKRMWISMYQRQAPMLNEAGVIEWDRPAPAPNPAPIHLLVTLLTLADDTCVYESNG
jgi:hypothetical protein